jgi:hypothetical protein
MPTTSSLHVLLAAGPEAPGVADLLARAQERRADGAVLRVLLSGAGLRWADPGRVGALRGPPGRAPQVDVAVCSRQAREAGWRAETTPEGIRWSSVATWLAQVPAGEAPLWVALP